MEKKVIMMAGMTGSGKSLMLNNLVNYVFGVNFKDNFRFKLIVDNDELKERGKAASRSKAESMTRYVSSYTLHYQEGFRVGFSLVLIDTPGFGDTKGTDFDQKITDNLRSFFENKVSFKQGYINCII